VLPAAHEAIRVAAAAPGAALFSSTTASVHLSSLRGFRVFGVPVVTLDHGIWVATAAVRASPADPTPVAREAALATAVANTAAVPEGPSVLRCMVALNTGDWEVFLVSGPSNRVGWAEGSTAAAAVTHPNVPASSRPRPLLLALFHSCSSATGSPATSIASTPARNRLEALAAASGLALQEAAHGRRLASLPASIAVSTPASRMDGQDMRVDRARGFIMGQVSCVRTVGSVPGCDEGAVAGLEMKAMGLPPGSSAEADRLACDAMYEMSWQAASDWAAHAARLGSEPRGGPGVGERRPPFVLVPANRGAGAACAAMMEVMLGLLSCSPAAAGARLETRQALHLNRCQTERVAVAAGACGPSRAAAWGVLRSSALELPGGPALSAMDADLCATPRTAGLRLSGSNGGGDLAGSALRGAAAYLPRLCPAPAAGGGGAEARGPRAASDAISASPGAWVVTGASGLLGGRSARWLMLAGATQLLLVSRSGGIADAHQPASLGVMAQATKCDAACHEDAASALWCTFEVGHSSCTQ
jgi:KR domain